MRKPPAAIGLTVLLLAVPAAKGATEVDLDRDHGVRFIVDGPVLTVRLEPQPSRTPPDVREDVWGSAVHVACSPLFTTDDRRLLRAVVTGELFWPDGQLELSLTFDRDISDRVKWCLLEGAGGEDVAGAMFEPFIRVLADPLRERRMGWALRRYIRSREDAEAWLPRAFAIVVLRGGRTAISAELARNARGRSVARRLCGLVRDSRVPLGPTAVFGRDDALLRPCSGRGWGEYRPAEFRARSSGTRERQQVLTLPGRSRQSQDESGTSSRVGNLAQRQSR